MSHHSLRISRYSASAADCAGPARVGPSLNDSSALRPHEHEYHRAGDNARSVLLANWKTR